MARPKTDAEKAACAPKLTDAEKVQVCEWLGQFIPPTEISRRLQEQAGKSLQPWAVKHYLTTPKWAPLIQRCRTEWAVRLLDVPIAHKRERLERLERLWAEAQADPHRTSWLKRQEALAVLREARCEMAEHQTTVQNIYLTSITNATDDELWARKEALLKKLEEVRPHGPRRSESGVETGNGHGAVPRLGPPDREGLAGGPG